MRSAEVTTTNLARELSQLSSRTPEPLWVIAHHTRFRAKLRAIRLQMLERQQPDADRAAKEKTVRALLASDVIEALPAAFKKLGG